MNLFEKEFSLDSISGIVQNDLIKLFKENSILLFFGELGSGKTSLIKEILRCFKINELVTSPTFNYINIYTASNGKKIYHFDLYRLNSLEEFLMLGFDEYLYEDAFILIEWPQIISEFIFSHEILMKRVYILRLNYTNSLNSRLLTIEFNLNRHNSIKS